MLLGADLLVTAAARANRTVTVDDAAIRVADQQLDRADVVGAEVTDRDAVDEQVPWLGLRPGVGPPRGPALLLQLAGGGAVAVSTRRPAQLQAALGVAGADPGLVRPATDDDLLVVPDIDERADTLFRVAGLDVPGGPVTVEALRSSAAVLVAGRPPVGVAQLDVVDGEAYLALLAVVPGSMRRGIGTRLLEAACDWARSQRLPAITLTTYAEVAWNGPFYAARGFAEVDEPGAGLAAIRDRERAAGLDAAGRRIVMRRSLPPSPPRPR